MDVGDVFTPRGYLDDMQQIEALYGSRGYIDVASARNLTVVRVPNTETGTMDLEFKIEEGQRIQIEKIEIRGNTKTKDRVIRRELAVSPGDVFDTVRVDLSKRRLQGLQYFSKVDARPEATDPVMSGKRDLVIGVEETDTGRMTMGAGFSSQDSLVLFAEISQRNFDLFHPWNFTGGGQTFRLKMQLGTERQDYELSFYEPWFLERKLGLGVDLYWRDLNFVSVEDIYEERLAGVHTSLRRALGSDRIIGSVGYTFQQVGILLNGQVINSNGPITIPYIPPTILAESGYNLVSKFDSGLAFDTRNSTFLPDKGQLTELTAELAGPFGGVKDYYKLEMKTHWYFKGLLSGHVLELLGGTGVADAWGRSSSTPFYDRYYLGGLYSLRGFQYHGVAPRDPPDSDGNQSKEPVGGNTYYFGSIEYSVPIIEHLRFAVFYDIGNVLLDPYTFGGGGYSDNWGFGLRLNIPRLGPLRLDYGIPINHDKFNSGNGRIQFSAGFERPF
jgi:outer membrane protein insertion porin family